MKHHLCTALLFCASFFAGPVCAHGLSFTPIESLAHWLSDWRIFMATLLGLAGLFAWSFTHLLERKAALRLNVSNNKGQ